MTTNAARIFHCEYCDTEYAKLDEALACGCERNTAHNALSRALWVAIDAALRAGVPEKRVRFVLVSATYANEKTWAYQLEQVKKAEKGGGSDPGPVGTTD